MHALLIASVAARPDARAAAVSPPTSLPLDIFESAGRGELLKVAKWLNTGGLVDTLCPTARDGRFLTLGLLHAAAETGQLEMARELLKRGASVDLQNDLGTTALMAATFYGHTSTVLLLLQHTANPNLQNIAGITALMIAALEGQPQEACIMEALLRAEANTELLDKRGRTALERALRKGHTACHTATAVRLLQHKCLSLGLGVALCAVLPFSHNAQFQFYAALGVLGLSMLLVVLSASARMLPPTMLLVVLGGGIRAAA